MAKSICSGCKRIFASVTAFDMHRIGEYGGPISKGRKVVDFKPSERRCLMVEEMQAKGMMQNDKGWWITEVFDPSLRDRVRSGNQEENDEKLDEKLEET